MQTYTEENINKQLEKMNFVGILYLIIFDIQKLKILKISNVNGKKLTCFLRKLYQIGKTFINCQE